MIKRLVSHRNLLKNLVLRDLKYRYLGSMGGFLWSVIHPLMLLVCYTFVFSIVFQNRPGLELFGTESFPVFLFCGILPWLLFQDTVLRNCSSITDNAQLITKTVIPAEIIPISVTISNLIHHLVGLTILLVVLAVFYGLHLSTFWIILYMPILLMFAQGLGWIVAGLHVFLRDTIQAVQILLFVWFWFTPIFWPRQLIPEEFRFLVDYNPLAVLVTGYRNALLHIAQPGALEIGVVTAASATVFVAGGLLFRRAKPAFPDVL